MKTNIIQILQLLRKEQVSIGLKKENIVLSNPNGIFSEELTKQIVNNKVEIVNFLKLASKTKSLNERLNVKISDDIDKVIISETLKSQKWRFIRYIMGGASENIVVENSKHNSITADSLSQALDELVKRHEILRTILIDDGGIIRQKILPSKVSKNNLSFFNSSMDKIEEDKKNILEHRFNFENEPLFRCVLISLKEGGHELLFIIEHVVSDLETAKTLKSELWELYHSIENNSPCSLDSVTYQFRHFVEYSNRHYSGDYKLQHKKYYDTLFRNMQGNLRVKPEFSGFGKESLNKEKLIKKSYKIPPELLKYDMGTEDYIYILEKKEEYGGYQFEIPTNVFKDLRKTSNKTKSSLFPLLSAICAIFFKAITNQREFIFFSPISMREHEGFLNVTGWLTSAIMFKINVEKEKTLIDLIQGCSEKIERARKHALFQVDISKERHILSEINIIYEMDKDYLNFQKPTYFDASSPFDFKFQFIVYNNKIIVALLYNKRKVEKKKIPLVTKKFLDLTQNIVGSNLTQTTIRNLLTVK